MQQEQLNPGLGFKEKTNRFIYIIFLLMGLLVIQCFDLIYIEYQLPTL